MMAATHTNRSSQAQEYNLVDMFNTEGLLDTSCCAHDEYPAAYAEKTSNMVPGLPRGHPPALSINESTTYSGLDFLRQRQPEVLTTAINRCMAGRSTAGWPGSDDSSFGSVALSCIADPTVPDNGYNPMLPVSHPPTSPFSATAALQSAPPSSQPPQPYNHQRTVSPNEDTHASAPNHALPFHNSGAHPAAPWQQNTSALNRPQCAQMGPPANDMCTAQTYGVRSSAYALTQSGKYCEQHPSMTASDRQPSTAHAPNELPVHSVAPLYDASVTHDVMGGGFVTDFEACTSGQQRVRGMIGCAGEESGGCSCGVPAGLSATAPWDGLLPPPSSKCTAGDGEYGIRPSLSYSPDTHLQTYNQLPAGAQHPHPYIHPYARPHSHSRRYGRMAEAYGMPPPYAPYWRGSYHPMASMSRSVTWLPGHVAPPPAAAAGGAGAGGVVAPSGGPQAGCRPDLAVYARMPDIYSPPYYMLPGPGGEPYSEYHPRVMYGRMAGRVPPAPAPPLHLPRSASADNTRVREHMALRVRMLSPYGTDGETGASACAYDSYVPMSSAAACSSFAPAWESLKRPRLAGSWSLTQPATPPPVPLSPPPTTPAQPQASVQPLTAPPHLATTTTTHMSNLSIPDTQTAAAAHASTIPGYEPHQAIPWTADGAVAHSAAALGSTALIPSSTQETSNNSDLDICFDELYLCMEGMEVNDVAVNVNGNPHPNPYSNGDPHPNLYPNGGGANGMAQQPYPGHQQHQQHYQQQHQADPGSSSALSPAPPHLCGCAAAHEGASSAPAAAPALPPAGPHAIAEIGVPDQPVPNGMKAAVDTVGTVETLPAIQQPQQTAQLQTETAEISSVTAAVVATPTAADTPTEATVHTTSVTPTSSRMDYAALLNAPSDVASAPFPSPYTASGCSSGAVTEPTGPAPSAAASGRTTNYRRGPRGATARRFHGNTSRQVRASTATLLEQAERAEPLPEPVKVTVAGSGTAGPVGGGGEGGSGRQGCGGRGSGSEGGSNDEQGQENEDGVDEGVVGSGGVIGMFHVLPYLEGAKCIEYGGEMVSRSAFERAGGSMMAKWYRSIKVLPDGVSLGKWLASNNLPVLKGNPRCSKKGGKQNGAES